jgi:hypothetical protein
VGSAVGAEARAVTEAEGELAAVAEVLGATLATGLTAGVPEQAESITGVDRMQATAKSLLMPGAYMDPGATNNLSPQWGDAVRFEALLAV